MSQDYRVVDTCFLNLKVDGEVFRLDPTMNKKMIFTRSVDDLSSKMIVTFVTPEVISAFSKIGKHLAKMEVQWGDDQVQSQWWKFLVVDTIIEMRSGVLNYTLVGIPEHIFKCWNSPSTKNFGQTYRPHEIAAMICGENSWPMGIIDQNTELVRRDFRLFNESYLEFIPEELIPFTCTEEEKPYSDWKAFFTTNAYLFNFRSMRLSMKLPAHRPLLTLKGGQADIAYSVVSRYSTSYINQFIAGKVQHYAMHLSAFENVPKMDGDLLYDIRKHHPKEMLAKNIGGQLDGAIHLPKDTVRPLRLNHAYKRSMKPELSYYYQHFLNQAQETVVELRGDPEFEVDRKVRLDVRMPNGDKSIISGDFYIRAVEEVIDAGRYTTVLKMIRPYVGRDD